MLFLDSKVFLPIFGQFNLTQTVSGNTHMHSVICAKYRNGDVKITDGLAKMVVKLSLNIYV